MAERVLSTRALNRALLARQLLLERSGLSLGRALERVGGIQSQYAPSAYIGLWSRLQDFSRRALTEALERRLAVQGTLMRVTIHIVSSRDYPHLAAGLRRSRRQWWLRVQGRQIPGVDMEAVAALLRAHLKRGPLRQAELVALLLDRGFPQEAWSGAGLWVDLVRLPPSGTWERRRADLYGLAEQWLRANEATEASGLELLLRRYLGAFGPAPLADVARWAGVPAGVLEPVGERLRLRHFRDERGGELLDLPRAPLPDPDTPAPVRFLPTWDATLLVHARRTQILPEQFRNRIFGTKNPQSVGTFLVDGVVAGTWRHHMGRVEVEPFGPLPRPARRELKEEAQRLSSFHAEEYGSSGK